MNIRKFSINKACILLGILLLLAVGVVSAAIYLLTDEDKGAVLRLTSAG